MSHLGGVLIRRRVWLASTGGDPGKATKAGTESHTRARSLYRTPGSKILRFSHSCLRAFRILGSWYLAPMPSCVVLDKINIETYF